MNWDYINEYTMGSIISLRPYSLYILLAHNKHAPRSLNRAVRPVTHSSPQCAFLFVKVGNKSRGRRDVPSFQRDWHCDLEVWTGA